MTNTHTEPCTCGCHTAALFEAIEGAEDQMKNTLDGLAGGLIYADSILDKDFRALLKARKDERSFIRRYEEKSAATRAILHHALQMLDEADRRLRIVDEANAGAQPVTARVLPFLAPAIREALDAARAGALQAVMREALG